MRLRRQVVSSAFFVASFALMPRAWAEDDAAIRCMASYERGQQLKKLEGKLSSALSQLRVCEETCPPVFREDCTRWRREAEALMPTVRFQVRDDRGARLNDVRVLADGQLLVDPAPRDSVMVDPGAHTFRFERAGSQSVEVALTLEPGERDHRVDVALAPAVSIPLRDEPPRPRNEPAQRAKPVLSYVFGAIGVAALAVGGVLLVKGHVDRAHLENTCAPRCNPADVDPIRTLWWASAATAGAGVLSMGAAILFWPRPTEAPPSLSAFAR